jgi:hypothetical protein
VHRNEKVNNFRFFKTFIDFEILHTVNVEKGIISCGVQNAKGVSSVCHT